MATGAVALAMNCASLMLPVEAIRPATLTAAVAPNITPLGFSSITWPLAFSVPSMALAPPPRPTRLTAIEVAPGWTNCTEAPLPMLNVVQSMIARWLVVTVIALPVVVVVAVPFPLATEGPVGSACALAVSANAAATARNMSFAFTGTSFVRQKQQSKSHRERSEDAHIVALALGHVTRH